VFNLTYDPRLVN